VDGEQRGHGGERGAEQDRAPVVAARPGDRQGDRRGGRGERGRGDEPEVRDRGRGQRLAARPFQDGARDRRERGDGHDERQRAIGEAVHPLWIGRSGPGFEPVTLSLA
jgi:hypothetical protein